MSKTNTRTTDEKLLIKFACDQGFDHPELMEAVERIKKCHEDELSDYVTFSDN